MINAKDIALLYFDLSNKSDFKGIEALLTDTTTYSSQATGLYLGRKDIVTMQRHFHGSFSSLHWNINSIVELKSGIVLIDYSFVGKKPDGHTISSSGLEYVIAYDGKIQHIEIRNKEVE
jgi:hypothetical protein